METICLRVEDVPLGRLRADVIVAAVDSLGTRQYLSAASFRLGQPWIDTAVDGSGWLVRVSVFVPRFDLALRGMRL